MRTIKHDYNVIKAIEWWMIKKTDALSLLSNTMNKYKNVSCINEKFKQITPFTDINKEVA